MTTIFNSTDMPDDLRTQLAAEFDVVDVPPGTTTGLADYGTPAAWLLDGDTVVDAKTLAQLPSLRLVSNYGVGYENIDVDDATAAGVVVTNTPGVLDNAVAELTLALILGIARDVVWADRWIRAGHWGPEWAPLTNDVHGTTLGIVGMGRIGRRVAELVAPLGIRVLYHNRNRNAEIDASGLAQYVEWEQLLGESDFVTLHTPLTERTRGFFTAEDFALMKRTAYLINTARGAVVDQSALLDALTSKRIAGAALDVFVDEPLSKDSPLLELDNVVLTPHVGSATVQTRRAMIELAVANVVAGARGERPQTPVNDLAG
ncbi:2-hydroxyacid dehydrogenase [Mycolicibacterium sp. YH-1]|uniref:2-hydroxyacid dehydrogenase n=1 Tax=Mycolicibacterium sp. YH-1 TaxID=2908837 RepID=UPI001F4C3858|nr:D-glycerate dehydrogenase [Mycolicibacterium sp. YH-1]UNB52031.1 D-glycerate dehydrogenase [Mycolicibacterium sp. YH-1]